MSASERVVLLLTKSQKAALTKRAAAKNVSVSEYVREAALGESAELAALQEMMQAAEASIDRANAALDTTFANMAARAAKQKAAASQKPRQKATARG